MQNEMKKPYGPEASGREWKEACMEGLLKKLEDVE